MKQADLILTPRCASRAAFGAVLLLCSLAARAQLQDYAGTTPGGDPQDAAAPATATQADPPARVVRISTLNGNVSAEPASVNTFSPAELNQVLTSGDRVYTGADAEAELQAGQIAVRMSGGADLTVTSMTDQVAQFGLAAGSVHLRSFTVDPGTVLELDTPEAAVTVLQAGDVRVDEDANTHATVISLMTGLVQVDGQGISRQMSPGERLRINGANPETGQSAYAEPLPSVGSDALDGFSDGRDGLYESGEQGSAGYVSPDTVGSADLASYGSWETNADLGAIWFPMVAVDWRPYCFGHWRWVQPWGWTWVGAEPWAFAPFHYGRWAYLGGRWGWVPGTPALRPVYAPAMVAFVGGPHFSTALGYGPGAGVTAWFPLGPREPYAPWYHGSTHYLNRVNASNIYNANAAEARAFSNQRAVNVFVNDSLANRSYVNRTRATVVVPETSFAAGQPVARNRLRIAAEQLTQAPLVPHPLVTPERTMVSPGAARVVPPQVARPALAERTEGREPAVDEHPVLANRPMFHHTDAPPVSRPSFEEQRQVMQRTDPGRPLSPQQVENLRENRPAGAQPGREAVPHPAPAPAPRSGPEPARGAPPSPTPRR